jgi:hypothetical protein
MSMFRSSKRQSTSDFDLLVPEARRRHVETRIFDNDVLDADYFELDELAARHSGNDNRRKAGVQVKREEKIPFKAAFAALGAFERRLGEMSINGFAALIAGAIVGIFLLSGGMSLFSLGQNVSEQQVNPLGITYVNITPQNIDGQDLLVISGVIENAGDQLMNVPKILASLSAQKGEFVASMIIQPPIGEIKPGNSHGFSAKFRHPGGKTPDIKLSFMHTDVSAR